MKRLLHRREQVLQDAARAELDFCRHLHAGGERVAMAVGVEVGVLQLDECAVEQARAALAGALLLARCAA